MSSEVVVEAEGASVEEAIADACRQAGIEPDAALVEVVSGGRAAVPGERIAAARARVRVEPIPEEGQRGRRHLEELLRLMGIEAQVTVTRAPRDQEDGAQPPLVLQVDGNDLGILIGWRGESLRALQTVVNLMLGPAAAEPGQPRLIVDIARYRERREQAVAQLARRYAAEVVRTGFPATLDPMAPYERRAVHLALASEPRVTTESSGLDSDRRVTIRLAPGVSAEGGPAPRRPGGRSGGYRN